MNVKSHIPNLLTLGNLGCGFGAIYIIFKDLPIEWACYLVLIAGVLDFFDGFVARALKVSGELGKQLDSLADMVTFGVVPGFLAWYLFGLDDFRGAIAVLITMFSALRLAKFNIDTRQHDTFIGVPTPMNTLFWIGMVFLAKDFPQVQELLNNIYFFASLTLFSAIFLVVNLPMIAFKFKTLDKAFYLKLFIFILPSIFLLLFFGLASLSLIYFHYLICSVLFKFALK